MDYLHSSGSRTTVVFVEHGAYVPGTLVSVYINQSSEDSYYYKHPPALQKFSATASNRILINMITILYHGSELQKK